MTCSWAGRFGGVPDLPVAPRAPRAKQATLLLACLAGPAQAADLAPALAANTAGGAWLAGLVLVLLVVLVGLLLVCGWLLRRERQLATALRGQRLLTQAQTDLHDHWQWRSNAQHQLLSLLPPPGPSRMNPAAVSELPGQPVAQAFPESGSPCLPGLLAGRAARLDTMVHCLDSQGHVFSARLRAVRLSDADGRFAGYLGSLQEHTSTTVLAPVQQQADAGPTTLMVDSPQPTPWDDSEQAAFGYTVSHDLRAPIRVVEGFTKILKEDYGRLLDRIGNDHLDRVLGAAARMNSMIDALLALSQLSSQPLSRQSVNLSQLATYVIEDLRRQDPERRVLVHIAPNLRVQGDPTLLRMVIDNLIGNAWKYSSKCQQAEIWFDRHARDNHSFTVRDNGAGFDMRFADRLFGVFQRLHSASDFQGTGVGLASVRRIVRRHGGEVWAESEPGHGAQFHFSLK